MKPPQIRTDRSNPFAHQTMSVRQPDTLRELASRLPEKKKRIRAGLRTLADALQTNSFLQLLEPLAFDFETWQYAFEQHGRPAWLSTEWLFAETYLFRMVCAVTRFFETGEDPFALVKEEELSSAALWEHMKRAAEVAGNEEEDLTKLLHYCLWGNRIDLSYRETASHGGYGGNTADLISNHTERVVRHLEETDGPVHIVTDNAGSELAADFMLARYLLGQGPRSATRRVVFHLKFYPTYVSDATAADVRAFLGTLESRGSAFDPIALELNHYLDSSRITLAPDPFWNSYKPFSGLPERLTRAFTGSALVILKGDLNYRKLVEDRIWPADTPLSEFAPLFPAPIALLRTMKSDPVVGLDRDAADSLDREDAQWRVNGRRGVLQFTGV